MVQLFIHTLKRIFFYNFRFFVITQNRYIIRFYILYSNKHIFRKVTAELRQLRKEEKKEMMKSFQSRFPQVFVCTEE